MGNLLKDAWAQARPAPKTAPRGAQEGDEPPLGASASPASRRNAFYFTVNLRWGYCATLTIALVWSRAYAHVFPLPVKPLATVCAFLALVNVALHYFSRRGMSASMATGLGLAADVAAFFEALVFTGGVSNPLTFLFTIPPVIASLALGGVGAILVALCSVACYFALFFLHLPFPLTSSDPALLLRVHLAGMWITFAFSVLMMSAWVSKLSLLLRKSEESLSRARLRQIEDESWLALGVEAASIAHEMSTPLNNLLLLSSEMAARDDLPPDLRRDVETMSGQLEICRGVLTRLRRKSDSPIEEVWIFQELERRVGRWRNVRPDARAELEILSEFDALVRMDSIFWSAFQNILNNAADAGSGRVRVSSSFDSAANVWRIAIVNATGALSDDQLSKAGPDAMDSEKPAGLGMGVKLTHATLSRLGGSLTLRNREPSGVEARIELPIEPLAAAARSSAKPGVAA